MAPPNYSYYTWRLKKIGRCILHSDRIEPNLLFLLSYNPFVSSAIPPLANELDYGSGSAKAVSFGSWSVKKWFTDPQHPHWGCSSTPTGAAPNYFILLVNSVGPGEREMGSPDENSVANLLCSQRQRRTEEIPPPPSSTPFSISVEEGNTH